MIYRRNAPQLMTYARYSGILRETRRQISITARRPMIIHESSEKSQQYEERLRPKALDETPMWEQFKQGFKMINGECRKFIAEKREHLAWDFGKDVQERQHGDFRMLWQLNSEESLNGWMTSGDSDVGEGYSTGKFEIGKNGHGLFTGYIRTDFPLTGNVVRAGYMMLRSPVQYRSFYRRVPYDFSRYTDLLIRCRGDGRQYGVCFQLQGMFDVTWFNQRNWMIFTHGGPYWQIAKIPLNKFYLTQKGGIVDDSSRDLAPTNHIQDTRYMGIVAYDKVDGPFRLEIDWMALVHDASTKNDYDYETHYYDIRKWGCQ